MMRLFALAFTFLSFTAAYSGGFKWPNVEYEYAELYFLNIPFDGPENLDNHVYSNGIYAKSKVGDELMVDQYILDDIHSTLARGADELAAGLSGCYIPRHGIIYFDKLGNPVASMTICFECERIQFWSTNPMNEWTKKPTDYDIARAEQQMTDIKNIFSKEGIPLFDSTEKYESFISSDELFMHQGEMFFHENEQDTIFNEPFKVGDIWLWVHKDYRAKKEFEEVNEVKFTNGGDKYIFKKFTDHKDSDFIYSMDEFPTIIEATIVSNKIILPNGIRVGMSLSQVQASFIVWDGIAWPEHIQALYPAYQIDYFFDKKTLVKIELRSR